MRGAAAACRWAVGTLQLRVRSIASKAAVKIFAALLLVAPALVKMSTNFAGWCCSSGRRSCRMVADKWDWPCAHGGGGGGASPLEGGGDFWGMYFGHGRLAGKMSSAVCSWLGP